MHDAIYDALQFLLTEKFTATEAKKHSAALRAELPLLGFGGTYPAMTGLAFPEAPIKPPVPAADSRPVPPKGK